MQCCQTHWIKLYCLGCFVVCSAITAFVLISIWRQDRTSISKNESVPTRTPEPQIVKPKSDGQRADKFEPNPFEELNSSSSHATNKKSDRSQFQEGDQSAKNVGKSSQASFQELIALIDKALEEWDEDLMQDEVDSEEDEESNVPSSEKTPEKSDLERASIAIQKLSDKKLRERLDAALKNELEQEFELDVCLWALVQRKKIEVLREIHKSNPKHVEILTALRRAEGRSDPLTVVVDSKTEFIKGTPVSLPLLKVSIKNVDEDKQTILFTKGGDYRSGRQARWRIELRDKNKKLTQVRSLGFFAMGGGIYTEETMSTGQSWETSLDLNSFVAGEIKPGKYQLTVFYHNRMTIDDDKNIDGLMASKSKTFSLNIEPIKIKNSKSVIESVCRHIEQIDESKKLIMVQGTYGRWAHDSVAPDSPQGKILSLGLKAVPTLITHSAIETYSPKKRSMIFSMLYSATGIHEPSDDVLGAHKTIIGPWAVWGAENGKVHTVGMGGGGTITTYSKRISKKSQRKLAARWKQWFDDTVEIVK